MASWFKWLVAVGLCTAARIAFTASVAQASCAAPTSCVCESWPVVHVLHGRFVDADGARTQVEVLDVLATKELDPVHAGDVIEGLLDRSTSCGTTLPELASGDEVLALWRGWPETTLLECPDYTDCMNGACASSSDGESCTSCLDSARLECPRNADLPRLVLVAWNTELDLGEGRVLAAEDAGLLGDRAQCLWEFPPPPPPPCDDVILVPVDDGCAAAGPRAANGGGAMAWLLVLLASAFALRRRVPR